MRKIKFRAWDKKENAMVNIGHWTLNMLNENRKPIMQFTGLKDKNDREIFEGDIVKFSTGFAETFTGEVKFIDGCFDIVSKNAGKYNTLRDYLKVYVANHAVEIIGNIHENRNLLNED